jgi:hypothetical protein
MRTSSTHKQKTNARDAAGRVVDVDVGLFKHAQLLERVRVLGVDDVPQMLKHLQSVDGLAAAVVIAAAALRLLRSSGSVARAAPRRGAPRVHHRVGVDQLFHIFYY